MDAATVSVDPDPDPDDGPAWPSDGWISPTVLKHYAQCPHRVRLEYIDRIPEPFVYNLHLIKGRIAHEILRQCARLVARRQPVFCEETLNRMVGQRFHPRDFPSIDAMNRHIADVLRWVHYATAVLDPAANYLVIERNNTRPVTVPASFLPHRLVARSDVILLRTDPDGERVVEFIDYKTGRRREDDLVPVFTRYVARPLLLQHLPDPTVARMRFTFLWLDARERQDIDLTLDLCESAWELVTRRIGALLAERQWRPRPSPLCRFCPYDGNPCTAR